MNGIEALSERLESLQITEEASNNYEQMDTEMSTAPAPAISNENIQVGVSKNIVPDLEWFDGN